MKWTPGKAYTVIKLLHHFCYHDSSRPSIPGHDYVVYNLMPQYQRLYAPGRKFGSQNWPKIIKRCFFWTILHEFTAQCSRLRVQTQTRVGVFLSQEQLTFIGSFLFTRQCITDFRCITLCSSEVSNEYY